MLSRLSFILAPAFFIFLLTLARAGLAASAISSSETIALFISSSIGLAETSSEKYSSSTPVCSLVYLFKFLIHFKSLATLRSSAAESAPPTSRRFIAPSTGSTLNISGEPNLSDIVTAASVSASALSTSRKSDDGFNSSAIVFASSFLAHSESDFKIFVYSRVDNDFSSISYLPDLNSILKSSVTAYYPGTNNLILYTNNSG